MNCSVYYNGLCWYSDYHMEVCPSCQGHKSFTQFNGETTICKNCIGQGFIYTDGVFRFDKEMSNKLWKFKRNGDKMSHYIRVEGL